MNSHLFHRAQKKKKKKNHDKPSHSALAVNGLTQGVYTATQTKRTLLTTRSATTENARGSLQFAELQGVLRCRFIYSEGA